MSAGINLVETNNMSPLMLHIYYLALFCGAACVAEKIRFLSIERPTILSYNSKYVKYTNCTSRRYGRQDPFYYVKVHVETLTPFANNVTLDFVFYEFLTNQYKRGFIEMHFKLCDMIHNNQFLGVPMKQGKLAQPCPYPPGDYHLYNMTIPLKNVPAHFPFTKGRIYLNLTSSDARENISYGHIDMEIKEINIGKKIN